MDPKHKSKLCQNYLRKKERDDELENMECSAHSPDPIELVWDELNRRGSVNPRDELVHRSSKAIYKCHTFVGTSATDMGRAF